MCLAARCRMLAVWNECGRAAGQHRNKAATVQYSTVQCSTVQHRNEAAQCRTQYTTLFIIWSLTGYPSMQWIRFAGFWPVLPGFQTFWYLPTICMTQNRPCISCDVCINSEKHSLNLSAQCTVQLSLCHLHFSSKDHRIHGFDPVPVIRCHTTSWLW